MLKRLSFALVAVSFTVPVVACLHQSEESGGSTSYLDEETKLACNFGFAEVADPLANKVDFGGGTTALVSDLKVAFGNFDDKPGLDFAAVKDLNHVQGFTSKGNGLFAKGEESNNIVRIADNSRKKTSLSIVGVGNFDGDDYSDILLAETSVKKDATAEGPVDQVDYRVLYGKANGEFAINIQPLPSVNEQVLSHVIGDLNDDGKDDIVILTATTQTALFSTGQRNLAPAPVAYANPSARRLAFHTPKTAKSAASLVIVTDDKFATLTFDNTNAVTATTETSWSAFAKGATRLVSDLDRNGKPELAMFADKLAIATLGSAKESAAPLTFADLAGHAKGALDLDNNGKAELVFSSTDETKLYAACGYGPTAKALAAVELPIPYGTDTFIAGTPDLNGDGKPDVVTFPTAGGFPKVYLAAAQITPAPPVTEFKSNLAEEPAKPDAGGDAAAEEDGGPARVDAGTEPPPVEVDSGTKPPPVEVDSGTEPPPPPVEVDAGTNPPPPPVEVDAGTNPPPPPPAKDAGAGPNGGGGGGTEQPEPPPSEPSGVKPPPKKTGTSTGATSSGSVTITPKPQPTQESDDGCAMTPASHQSAPSSTAIAGLLAAMTLLVRRRKKA